MDPKRRDNNEEEEVEDLHEEHSEFEEDTVGQELEDLRNLATQLDNQLKRSLADYQNLQRRVQEEKSNWIRTANKDLLLKLLPVLDTLMLAEKHTKDKNFVLTVQQFLQALKDEGVEKIATVGEQFDANTMEATGTTEGKEGEVMEEVRAGYLYHGGVLRPAQVIVGQ